MTPLEEVYGIFFISVISYLPGLYKVQEVEKALIAHANIICTLKDILVLNQN